jgi:hypothetical protein
MGNDERRSPFASPANRAAMVRCPVCGRLEPGPSALAGSGRAPEKICADCARPALRPSAVSTKRYSVLCFICGRRGWMPIPLSASLRPEHIVCPRCQTQWPKRLVSGEREATVTVRPTSRRRASPTGGKNAGLGLRPWGTHRPQRLLG